MGAILVLLNNLISIHIHPVFQSTEFEQDLSALSTKTYCMAHSANTYETAIKPATKRMFGVSIYERIFTAHRKLGTLTVCCTGKTD